MMFEWVGGSVQSGCISFTVLGLLLCCLRDELMSGIVDAKVLLVYEVNDAEVMPSGANRCIMTLHLLFFLRLWHQLLLALICISWPLGP